MHDVIIIGGGPAGLAATAYAIRKRMDVLLISPGLGGRTNRKMELPWVDDYNVLVGESMVERFRSQIEYLDFLRVRTLVERIEPRDEGYCIILKDGKEHWGRAVLLATGAQGELLNVPGEAEYEMKGLCYSTATYAPLFIDRTALVVGDGCQAFRAVAELQRIARHVTLVAPTHGDLDLAVARNLAAMPNVTILDSYEVVELKGDAFVRAVVLRKDGEITELHTDAVFVEKDLKPNSALVADLVELDPKGFVKIDEMNRTSRPGIYAAGDVTTAKADQVLISMGEGAKAMLAIYDDLLGIC
ncbi:MAG: FAD-dependent oxidoreductase [Nitrososphaerales archaeon]|nr:FAD-dependent oxidoreductase [Nitrososphaerales archaeon]